MMHESLSHVFADNERKKPKPSSLEKQLSTLSESKQPLGTMVQWKRFLRGRESSIGRAIKTENAFIRLNLD
jgi:hypothetical protein